MREAGANRYAAEQLQSHFLNWYESQVPIYKDFEVPATVLRGHDVIFVGRPEANSALAAWAGKLGLDYNGASFRLDGTVHASEREALVWTAANPLDPQHMALVYAGNDALRTVKALSADGEGQYILFKDGGKTKSGFVKN